MTLGPDGQVSTFTNTSTNLHPPSNPAKSMQPSSNIAARLLLSPIMRLVIRASLCVILSLVHDFYIDPSGHLPVGPVVLRVKSNSRQPLVCVNIEQLFGQCFEFVHDATFAWVKFMAGSGVSDWIIK
jgi:hypothetical protein